MFTACPPLRDVAVHAHAVAEVHALPVDEAERVHARRERALARPTARPRRARAPRGTHLEPCAGASARCTRMSRSKGWNIIAAATPSKHPGLDHLDLAAAALLRGRAEELDLATGCVGDRRSAEERADRARRDEVVTAGVTDLRAARRTHRGSRPAGRPPAARLRAERGRHAGDAPLDGEPALREELGDPACGPCAPRSGAPDSRGCRARAWSVHRARGRRRRRRTSRVGGDGHSFPVHARA